MIFKNIFFLFLLGLLNIFLGFSYISFIDNIIDGYKVKIIKVKLDKSHYIMTNIKSDGNDKKFSYLAKEIGAIAGVNGAYFCPKDYSHCGDRSYSNVYRIMNGKVFSKFKDDLGLNGLFGIDINLKPVFILNDHGYISGSHLKKININKFDKLYYGISNYPILLFSGKNFLKNYWTGFFDRKMIKSPIKNFICNVNDNLIYMGWIYDINLFDLPLFLKHNFNCKNAILLDMGGSLAMMYGGKIIKDSGRPIMDGFFILDRKRMLKYQIKILKNRIRFIKSIYGKNYKNEILKYKHDIKKIIRSKDDLVVKLVKLNKFLYDKFLISNVR